MTEGDFRQTDCGPCWLLAPPPNQRKKWHDGLIGMAIWSGRKCPLAWESEAWILMAAPPRECPLASPLTLLGWATSSSQRDQGPFTFPPLLWGLNTDTHENVRSYSKRTDLRFRQIWVWILYQPLTRYVVLGKLHHFSGSRCPNP